MLYLSWDIYKMVTKYQAACIATCDSINDMIIVLLYWFNHECGASEALSLEQMEHLIRCIGIGPPLGH